MPGHLLSDEENEFCEVFTTLDSPSGPITLNQKTTHVHQPAIPSPQQCRFSNEDGKDGVPELVSESRLRP